MKFMDKYGGLTMHCAYNYTYIEGDSLKWATPNIIQIIGKF
jgi:hypothetical protein